MRPPCPQCGSERTRAGGMLLWGVYLALIALALVAVLGYGLNAALVAGVMIAVIILVRLIRPQRVCLDCGHQWPTG